MNVLLDKFTLMRYGVSMYTVSETRKIEAECLRYYLGYIVEVNNNEFILVEIDDDGLWFINTWRITGARKYMNSWIGASTIKIVAKSPFGPACVERFKLGLDKHHPPVV